VTSSVREEWDRQADAFDDEPDHGLRDPGVRAAWDALLSPLLPAPPATVLDLGCGTGSLSVLLAERGYDVTGVDLSPRMVQRAGAKAAEHQVSVRLLVGDASHPRGVADGYRVVLARHLLWALPEPAAALDRWSDLLAPGGTLLLVEGLWGTGAGLAADDVLTLVRARYREVRLRLLPDPALWGGPISDQRYVVTATSAAPGPAGVVGR
jgi:SAM-dependent methyltransferase